MKCKKPKALTSVRRLNVLSSEQDKSHCEELNIISVIFPEGRPKVEFLLFFPERKNFEEKAKIEYKPC